MSSDLLGSLLLLLWLGPLLVALILWYRAQLAFVRLYQTLHEDLPPLPGLGGGYAPDPRLTRRLWRLTFAPQPEPELEHLRQRAVTLWQFSAVWTFFGGIPLLVVGFLQG